MLFSTMRLSLPALAPIIVTLAIALGGIAERCGATAPKDSLFSTTWDAGLSADEPTLQVQRLKDDVFVIRQSLRTNFEGPFLYLIFGRDKVLLLDTGAGGLLIRPTIDRLIEDWRKANGQPSLQLIVAHSHTHRDHVAGDSEFRDRPNTTLVGHSTDEVAKFFQVKSWPGMIGQLDLGGRKLSIIPTPGHQNAHIAVFDHRSRLLLSGDMLYPGRVFVPVNRIEVMRKSVDRVIRFGKSHRVKYVLGAHIEMNRAGVPYPDRAVAHPNEPVLELPFRAFLAMKQGLRGELKQPFTLIPREGFIIWILPARLD